MKVFTQDIDVILGHFTTSPTEGLSSTKVIEQRKKYGPNVLPKKEAPSLARRILNAAKEPMILMLIMAGIIAILVNLLRSMTHQESDYLECLGIFVAIGLSIIITVVMEGRSAKAFDALSKMNSDTEHKVIRDGQIKVISQSQLVVGDLVLLATGDKIPADGRLLDSTGLIVDESALTGESHPVEKEAGFKTSNENLPLAEQKNMVFSGNFILEGYGKMLITAVGSSTEFGKIAQELSDFTSEKTPLQEKLAHLGRRITILGIAASGLVFLVEIASFILKGTFTLSNVLDAFVTSIVLIVAAVPEGLPTIVAVSLSLNIIKLSRQNALVKKMIASETIGCIDVICSDKTGTLTQNKMTVRGFYTDRWYDNVKTMDSSLLSHNICLNTTAHLGPKEEFIGNPTECALLKFYQQSQACQDSHKSYEDERIEHDIIHAFPFSSELKHMTTISKVDGSIISYVKGSPEAILDMCSLSRQELVSIHENMENAQSHAMRVIAFAHKQLDQMRDYEDQDNHIAMETNMVFDGFVAIQDPLRDDVKTAIETCQSSGIQLKILTGDNLLTASSIAKELNLLDANHIAIEASEINHLNDQALIKKLPKISVIARSTPHIKMRIVNLLKNQGHVVAVTGDGINDSIALKKADVGISMGISGTDVAKEASDIVLLDDSFSTIVTAIRWGRGIYQNFKRFIQFQLTVNLTSVLVVLSSILLGYKAPFSALQLLWINIIMDGPPALTLGLEPIHDDLMAQSPIRRNAPIVSRQMGFRILLSGLYMSILFLAQYKFNFLGAAEDKSSTVLFTLFSLFSLFNAFNCREIGLTSIVKHFLDNRIMIVVLGLTFLLQFLIIQFGGSVFRTSPLSMEMWIKVFILAISIIPCSELLKLVLRSFK